MREFIKLHINDKESVYINPDHIVKMEVLAYPQRTLISTVDDTVTTVWETPEEVLDRIYREGRE